MNPNTGDLPGIAERTIIVTGAASGIGAAAAASFAAAGARVLLVDRDREGLDRVVADLDPGRTATCHADLLDPASPQKIVDAALNRFGTITTVLHIAGAFCINSIADSTHNDMDLQIKLNVEAPYFLTQAALPHLKPGAQIVFCASTSAFVGSAQAVIYCATKAGLLGMVRAMAVELAPQGVRVNAVAPGTTKTPINDEMFAIPGVLDRILNSIPDGRIAEAHEHVGAFGYLISDLAKHVHGHAIAVDGGLIAK